VKLGLLTYDIAKDWDLPTLLDRAKEIGFEGIEFRVDVNHRHGVELHRTKEERKRIREMCRDAGVACTADVGAPGLKVFGNAFHEGEGIPKEQTIRQVAKAVRECDLCW